MFPTVRFNQPVSHTLLVCFLALELVPEIGLSRMRRSAWSGRPLELPSPSCYSLQLVGDHSLCAVLCCLCRRAGEAGAQCGCRATSSHDTATQQQQQQQPQQQQQCGATEWADAWLHAEAPVLMDLMGAAFCACEQVDYSVVCELNVENDVNSVEVRESMRIVLRGGWVGALKRATIKCCD
jgi:hypothetical protein